MTPIKRFLYAKGPPESPKFQETKCSMSQYHRFISAMSYDSIYTKANSIVFQRQRANHFFVNEWRI